MSEDQDDSQKTEEPTHKRLEEAAKKGQVANSREVTSFFLLLVLTMLVIWASPAMLNNARESLAPFVQSPHDFEMDTAGIGDTLKASIKLLFALLAIPFLATVTAAIAGRVMQGRILLSAEPMIPKLEKLSPLKGFKRLFSARSFVEFLKGIVKITVVGIVATLAIWPQMPVLRLLPTYDFSDILTFLSTLAGHMLIGVCIVMFFIALIDFAYQRYEHIKSLRMTKQEVRDEYKQQEGDPIVKQRLRAIRMERARKRMMAAVPSSDVVITNPTHYAVALQYDSNSMKAPVLLAKGADKVAFRIRELAKEHDIPIVENPPLARALFSSVGLDEEIPYEHYKAVAEVIGYIYRMRKQLPIRKPPVR